MTEKDWKEDGPGDLKIALREAREIGRQAKADLEEALRALQAANQQLQQHAAVGPQGAPISTSDAGKMAAAIEMTKLIIEGKAGQAYAALKVKSHDDVKELVLNTFRDAYSAAVEAEAAARGSNGTP